MTIAQFQCYNLVVVTSVVVVSHIRKEEGCGGPSSFHIHKGNKKRRSIILNDVEFTNILNQLNKYLAMEKKFIINTKRETEFKKAIEIACNLFPDSKIYTEDDPLQMGAMILCIEDFDLSVAGKREINLFHEMTELADNFEIYAIDESTVKFAAVFQKVLTRI